MKPGAFHAHHWVGAGSGHNSSGRVRAVRQRHAGASPLYATSWHQLAVRDAAGHARWILPEVTCQSCLELLLRVREPMRNSHSDPECIHSMERKYTQQCHVPLGEGAAPCRSHYKVLSKPHLPLTG